MILAYISDEQQHAPFAFLKRLWLTLVLAVVLSALEVERRERFTEPVPIVMTISYYPPPLLRMRPYRSHYRELLARSGD
jgi:hypothetical protein